MTTRLWEALDLLRSGGMAAMRRDEILSEV
jgi:hypothetical protein